MLFLYYVGEEVNEIFEILFDIGDDYDIVVVKFMEYFVLNKNVEFEIYKFR